MKRGKREGSLTPTTITSIAAVFIAVLSLAVSIYFTVRHEAHERLASRPILTFEASNAPIKGRTHFGLYLLNVGLGPAIPDRISVSLDGNIVPSHRFGPFGAIAELVRQGLILGPYGFAFSLTPQSETAVPLAYTEYFGFAIPPGGESFVLGCSNDCDNPGMRSLLEELFASRLEIQFYYRSAFGEVYLLTFP